ncbi:unnamed protein product [Rotaria socialis]|uniref:Arrestin-like N-terminal domain-containing protein n=1 Tax=Rotaria socialis TaxID=392032 RepID=A0A817Z9Q8_9BILA|nr:unnamed protein product [Rotaria socialis]CAF3577928.1 unnamed protein product [Rotaria socialis]CAF4442140.1 unnamed protein product [Rotaria socialis]CAF4595998.1 unnamed protein product [Rotaria socialis]
MMLSCIKNTNILASQIQLTPTDGKEFYFDNETLVGKVILKTKETISSEELSLSFIGELVTSYTTTPVTTHSTSTTITNTDIFLKHVIVLSSQPNEESTLADTENFNAFDSTLSPVSTFSFTFTIPDSLPPSIFAFGGHTGYYLLLEFMPHGEKAKEIKKLPITIRSSVLPPVDPQANTYSEKKGNLSVNIKMEPSYISSEKPELPFEITINNPGKDTIKKIKVIYTLKRQVKTNKNRDDLVNVTINATSHMQEEDFHGKYLFALPQAVLASSPSYTYSESSNISDTIRVHYVLKVEICVNGWFKNVNFKIPVFVANKQ